MGHFDRNKAKEEKWPKIGNFRSVLVSFSDQQNRKQCFQNPREKPRKDFLFDLFYLFEKEPRWRSTNLIKYVFYVAMIVWSICAVATVLEKSKKYPKSLLMQVRVTMRNLDIWSSKLLHFVFSNGKDHRILGAIDLIYYFVINSGWKCFPLHYHCYCHKFIRFIYNFRSSTDRKSEKTKRDFLGYVIRFLFAGGP